MVCTLMAPSRCTCSSTCEWESLLPDKLIIKNTSTQKPGGVYRRQIWCQWSSKQEQGCVAILWFGCSPSWMQYAWQSNKWWKGQQCQRRVTISILALLPSLWVLIFPTRWQMINLCPSLNSWDLGCHSEVQMKIFLPQTFNSNLWLEVMMSKELGKVIETCFNRSLIFLLH